MPIYVSFHPANVAMLWSNVFMNELYCSQTHTQHWWEKVNQMARLCTVASQVQGSRDQLHCSLRKTLRSTRLLFSSLASEPGKNNQIRHHTLVTRLQSCWETERAEKREREWKGDTTSMRDKDILKGGWTVQFATAVNKLLDDSSMLSCTMLITIRVTGGSWEARRMQGTMVSCFTANKANKITILWTGMCL